MCHLADKRNVVAFRRQSKRQNEGLFVQRFAAVKHRRRHSSVVLDENKAHAKVNTALLSPAASSWYHRLGRRNKKVIVDMIRKNVYGMRRSDRMSTQNLASCMVVRQKRTRLVGNLIIKGKTARSKADICGPVRTTSYRSGR